MLGSRSNFYKNPICRHFYTPTCKRLDYDLSSFFLIWAIKSKVLSVWAIDDRLACGIGVSVGATLISSVSTISHPSLPLMWRSTVGDICLIFAPMIWFPAKIVNFFGVAKTISTLFWMVLGRISLILARTVSIVSIWL